MRDFSWKYFTLTGDVESFMLYKEVDQYGVADDAAAYDGQDEEFASMDVQE
ncbi:YqzL family protein [Paenibacillus sp. LHD-117]|uniref:YqzL family protein n=1 Tax=Paenibacillus sp. LHD-117 TaxID=3071412 RepID=UPI0027E00648|nr:YqzL family protein [Paenibacillus sp. LHD-117]MDQ6421110.1 YqzL family protein [Paenibacillus sp. LHD-117]